MGWTDLFRSRSLKLKPDPLVRWFGKLPTYGDYYSSKADEEWVVEFNDWLLKGYQIFHSRRAPADAKKRLPLCGCIVRLPKTGMTVFATLQDFGGDARGRPFPLAFYVALPSNLWPGPTSDRLSVAVRVLRDLHAMRDKVVKFINSPGHFDTVFADREVHLDGLDDEKGDDTWVRGSKALTFDDWFTGARDGLNVADSATWCRVSQNWGANIAKYESKDFEPTLRLPLAMRLPLEPQIAGWLRWLEGRMDLKRRFLSLLTSGEPNFASGRLSIVARDIAADDFLLLTPQAGTLSYVDDLCSVQPPAETDGAAAAVPASWMDFVSAAPSTA